MSSSFNNSSLSASCVLDVGKEADFARAVEVSLGLGAGCAVVISKRILRDQRSVKFTGNAGGQDFFAKILIADPYPIGSGVPWHEVIDTSEMSREVAKQVELESGARAELALMMDVNAIPACIGASAEFGAIVWERVCGISALRLLRRGYLVDHIGTKCRAIALQAGKWLRQLHDATSQGAETLDIHATVSALKNDISRSASAHLPVCACEVLQDYEKEIGSAIQTPVSLTHGDFTLVNLLWDHAASQLYVTDFENYRPAGIWQDLASMIFSLRRQLFNPLTSAALVREMEQLFWRGYGTVEPEVFKFVQAFTISKLMMHRPESFEGYSTWAMEVADSLYRNFLRPTLISRVLPEFPN